jgi:SAM-dependent methyltransferase
MYHDHVEAGSSAAYWEEFGSGSTLADHLRFCEVDPLRPLFERVLKRGAKMLEGGCGRGQYVAYYGARGVMVVGLDFAREWLRAAHAEYPSLRLCTGDVGALPFADGAFDVYYSGGVVEHFENGADRPLAEAHRVLKRDGVLLVSVPYFSPLRRLIAAVGRPRWRTVEGPAVDRGAGSPSLRFYQYAYTIPEFTALLAKAGFRVTETQGYAVVWGLYDVPFVERLAARFQARAGSNNEVRTDGAPASSGVSGNGTRPSLLKRLIVAEDSSVAVAGAVVRLARLLFANMMMYVCVPIESKQAA